MSSKTKVGGREVSFNPVVMMRIEQRTGKTCGDLVEHIGGITEAVRAMQDADDKNESGIKILAKMADITLTVKFVAGTFNIPNDIVSVDYGDNLFEIFGELIPLFTNAVASMTGGSASMEADEGKPEPASDSAGE